jgi:hypothetical protein
MKHILTTIAAVLVVGCGKENPQSIESASNVQTNNTTQGSPQKLPPHATSFEPLINSADENLVKDFQNPTESAQKTVSPATPKAAVKLSAPASDAVGKDKVHPPEFTKEVYKKAFPEISGYYYKKSNPIRRQAGNTLYPSYRTAIGTITISKTIDDKGLRPIFSFANNSIMAYVEEHKILTSKYKERDGAVLFMVYRAKLLNENREHIGYWDREWFAEFSTELYAKQMRGDWKNSVKEVFYDLNQQKTGGLEIPQNSYKEPKFIIKNIKGKGYPFLQNAPIILKTIWGIFPTASLQK